MKLEQDLDTVSTSCCDAGHCSVIDISTTDSLHRDFNNWLHGVGASVSHENVQPSPNSDTSDEPKSPDSLPEPQKCLDGRKNRRKGTNLYGRPYCPGRPLSMAERTQIIQLHTSGMKVNAISKSLCISHGCVSKIISRYRQTGVLSPASSPEQRKSRRKKSENIPMNEHPYVPAAYIEDPVNQVYTMNGDYLQYSTVPIPNCPPDPVMYGYTTMPL